MNIFSKMKNAINEKRTAIVAGNAGVAAIVSKAYCLSGKLDKVTSLVYDLTKFAGTVLIAIGVVQLVRCVIALTGGDQLQPGQLGKAIAMIAAGIAACMLETIVNTFK